MWFIGVEVEQETRAPAPKKNPGSALVIPFVCLLPVRFLLSSITFFCFFCFIFLAVLEWLAAKSLLSYERIQTYSCFSLATESGLKS